MYRRKRIDPRVIGSFVVGAILLSVAGLIFFGPGGLFSETRMYVLHFDRSVKGLNVGSPVRFRGVKIGQVKDINVRLRPTDFQFHIPVVIEIEPTRIETDGGKQSFLESIKTSMEGDDPIQPLVEKGLRAQLELDSLVTGQLYVNFDMHPDKPANLTGYSTEYPELPTIGSRLGELTKTFEDLPLKELANKLINSADGFERVITSPSLHSGLAQFDQTATNLNQLLENLNTQLIPLAKSLRLTLEETRNMIGHMDSKIDPLSQDIQTAKGSFQKALDKFSAAAEKTTTTMEQIQTLTSDDSRLQQQLSFTLQEMNNAARSVRYLSSEIERDPQILLRGRANGGSK